MHENCFSHCLSRRHSDYLWLRAVLLTNATVATVGLGLTIPLAFGSDLLLGKPNVLTPSSIFGALTVLSGFVLVNIGNNSNDNEPNHRTTMNSGGPLELPTRIQSSNEEENDDVEDTLVGRTID